MSFDDIKFECEPPEIWIGLIKFRKWMINNNDIIQADNVGYNEYLNIMSNNLEKSESPTTCSSHSLSQLNIMEISLAWMKTYIKLNPSHAGYLNIGNVMLKIIILLNLYP